MKKTRKPIWQRPGWQTVSRERKGPYVSDPSDYQDVLSTYECFPTKDQIAQTDKRFAEWDADFQRVRSETPTKTPSNDAS